MVKWALVVLGVIWLLPVATMLYIFTISAWHGYYEPMALVYAAAASATVFGFAVLADKFGKTSTA